MDEANIRTTSMYLRRVVFSLFRVLLGRTPWEVILKKRGVQEN